MLDCATERFRECGRHRLCRRDRRQQGRQQDRRRRRRGSHVGQRRQRRLYRRQRGRYCHRSCLDGWYRLGLQFGLVHARRVRREPDADRIVLDFRDRQ